jgi:hypothetical protein
MDENPVTAMERIRDLEIALLRLREQLDTITSDLGQGPGDTSLVIRRVNVMKLIMVAQSETDAIRAKLRNI